MPQGAEASRLTIRRSRLIEPFIGRSETAASLVCVVAPAGFGKTTLLAAAAAESASTPGAPPAVAISLRDCEHHPNLAIDLLVAALHRRLPAADLSPLLDAKPLAGATGGGARVASALDTVLERAGVPLGVVMLDDTEFVSPGEPLGAVLTEFIRARSPRIRLAMASRAQPSIDLRAAVAPGALVSLGAADLAFSGDELGAFLAARVGAALPQALRERAWERTRGWPGVAAIVAADLPADASAALAQLTDALDGRARQVQAALNGFVLERLLPDFSPQQRYFTKVISVLDRIDLLSVSGLFVDSGPRSRGRTTSARFVIALPGGEIPGYLDRLVERQLLEASRPGGDLQLNPLIRESLRALLELEDPRVYREAHRRAALVVAATPSKTASAAVADSVSISHWLAAGEYDRVLTHLEQNAERTFAAGELEALGRWLADIEAHYTTLPYWANYYAGRIATASGQWDRARAYLDMARGQVADPRADVDAALWQPRIQLGYATLYWRRGVPTEASTYCRRGLDFLRHVQRPVDLEPRGADAMARVQLDLLNLLGTVRMETGAFDKARQVCLEAAALASERGLEREHAVALQHLGRIAARQGHIGEAREHLERALALVDPADTPSLYADLRFVTAQTAMMAGHHGDARAGIEAAMGSLNGTASPEATAAMQAELGWLAMAGGDLKLAATTCQGAVRTLEGVTDSKIVVDVLDVSAVVLSRAGETQRAAALVERASATVRGLLRGDTYAVARHDEARAELSAARENLERALEYATASIDRYTRLGCEWHAARLQWRRALWQHRQFAEGAVETPGNVNEELDEACAAASRYGYRFETGPEYHELLQVGASFGSETTRERCRVWLEELPEVARDQGLSARAATRYRDYRRRAELADDYLVSSRAGRRGANARQVETAIAEAGKKTLVLVAHEQYLVLDGEQVPLGEKRVILPLLLQFLRHPERTFGMDELAAEVWGAEGGRTSMQTKVKVAISRLRALLGKEREYVVTGRVELPDGSGSVVGYGLAEDLDFLLVEQVEVEA